MLSNKTRGLNNIANSTALNNDSSELCLPSWILDAVNVQSVYISDTVITVVSIPFALFAVVANLAVLVIIIRSPSLHRPVNVMLCSLAASDCLTGLVLQPVYIAWRFLLHHFQDTCKLVHLYQASKSVPFMLIGCTFVNLSIMSVERLYAVSKPLAYSAKITLQGMKNYGKPLPVQMEIALHSFSKMIFLDKWKMVLGSLNFRRLLRVLFSSQQRLNRPAVKAAQWRHYPKTE